MKMKRQLIALCAAVALASSAFAFTNITSDITTNTTWTTAGNPYILDHVIYVKNGATLDIAPGVIIRGQPRVTGVLEDAGALIVAAGSKIQARGTSAQPIIFTTAAKLVSDGNPATLDIQRWSAGDPNNFLDANPATSPLPPLLDLRGDGSADDKVMQLWGGLVLAGFAQTNNYQDVNGDTTPEQGVGLIEGLSGADATYGGFDDLDSSGTVQYVSIRHGGDGVVPTKELNALTCYSVGSGTTIRYVDVYCTSDDGVEVFGGSVNFDHLNINYADDDGFDTDEGYRGTAQFVFVLQGLGYGDKCLELDGDDWDEGQAQSPLYPISDVQIRNGTFISRNGSNGTDIRNGFNGAIINSIFWKEGAAANTAVSISGLGAGDVAPSPVDHLQAGRLQIRNTTVWNFSTAYTTVAASPVGLNANGSASGSFGGSAIPNVYYPATNNRDGSSAAHNPGFTITHGSVINAIPTGGAGAIGVVQPLDYVRSPGGFTTYRGCFDPTLGAQWTAGWTALSKAGILAN